MFVSATNRTKAIRICLSRSDEIFQRGIRARAAADLILSLIITIWGTKRCFAINQSGSGGDFIARMTCLTLPGSIRWTVVVIRVAREADEDAPGDAVF